MHTISRKQARRFYDQFGARQDRQGFYEDAALDLLIELGDFSHAQRVFELGCGTGRFAAHLLENHLPASARYVGIDLSPKMAQLARERLDPFSARCEVHTSSGEFEFSNYAVPFDRIIRTYVLDLLSLDDIRRCLAAAHSVMVDGGLFCHAGLTIGTGPISRTTSSLWSLVHRIVPLLTGGCRPLKLADLLPDDDWRLLHRRVVISSAIASEVVIAQPRASSATRPQP